MGEKVIAFDNYAIYRYIKVNVGTYYLCKPTFDVPVYDLLIGFPNRELNNLSTEEMVREISMVMDTINSSYSNVVYLLPLIPYNMLVDAALENDYKTDRYGNVNYNQGKFAEIYRSILAPILNDVCYYKLQQKVNPMIRMLKRDETSIKFIHWLDIRNFYEYGEERAKSLIEEIDYNQLVRDNKIDDTVNRVMFEIPPTSSDNASGGIAPVNHDFDNSNDINKSFVKRKVKPKSSSPGFSNIRFIIGTLLISMIIGISIGYMLIK